MLPWRQARPNSMTTGYASPLEGWRFPGRESFLAADEEGARSAGHPGGCPSICLTNPWQPHDRVHGETVAEGFPPG